MAESGRREQVLQLLIGLKRLADERMSSKPRPVSTRTQSERWAPRELTLSSDDTVVSQVSQNRQGDANSSQVELQHCTPNLTFPYATLGDSFSVTPTPPRLRRTVMSDDHLESTDRNSNTTATNSVSVPMLCNRRRAVSDSLVRFLGMDGEDRIVPPSERDQWLDTLDPSPANLIHATTTKTADLFKEAWDAAILQAKELDDIGIEVR